MFTDAMFTNTVTEAGMRGLLAIAQRPEPQSTGILRCNVTDDVLENLLKAYDAAEKLAATSSITKVRQAARRKMMAITSQLEVAFA